MTIRKAEKKDIPFIVNAIIEIEKTADSDTFSNLFGSSEAETRTYLTEFLNDDENFDTELSLNTYSLVEIDDEPAGCCTLFFTDSNYYQNKSELFPIHLKPAHLQNFIDAVQDLPDTKEFSKNKFFLEYLYVNPKFRGMGVSKKLLEHLAAQTERLYLIPLENNNFAIEFYRRSGFVTYEMCARFPIDRQKKPVYPFNYKVMLYRDQI